MLLNPNTYECQLCQFCSAPHFANTDPNPQKLTTTTTKNLIGASLISVIKSELWCRIFRCGKVNTYSTYKYFNKIVSSNNNKNIKLGQKFSQKIVIFCILTRKAYFCIFVTFLQNKIFVLKPCWYTGRVTITIKIKQQPLKSHLKRLL